MALIQDGVNREAENFGIKIVDVRIKRADLPQANSDAIFRRMQTEREDFAKSTARIIEDYDADGIDLDWEYPAISGFPGHTYRPEDKDNFTDLIVRLRKHMKAIYFDGEKGDDIRYEEIPEHLQEQAQQSRNDMLEAVSMFDDQMMEDLLEEKEISETAIHDAVCKGVQTLEFCPVFLGSAFKNRGVQPLLFQSLCFVCYDMLLFC